MENITQNFIWLSLIADIILIITVIIGMHKFIWKKTPLYFRILFLAIACYASVSIFHLLYYVCYQVNYQEMGITFFGYLGCYMFLFSANYDQYDSFVDDGTDSFKKYRLISIIAPVIVFLMVIIHVVLNVVKSASFVDYVADIVFIPAILASYYNLKHFIIPDLDFLFVRWARRANLCALIIEFADALRVFYGNYLGQFGVSMLSLIISIMFLMMMLFAEKGKKVWLQ